MPDVFDLILPDKPKPDIFDRISQVKKPVAVEFSDEDELKKLRSQLIDIQNKISEKEKKSKEFVKQTLSEELRNFIRDELSKIRIEEKVVERIIEKQPIIQNTNVPIPGPAGLMGPPGTPGPEGKPGTPGRDGRDGIDGKTIVKEVRVETEYKEIPKKLYETKIEDLGKEVRKLKKDLVETRRIAESPLIGPGGPGVIGIPPPEPHPDSYVLSVNKGKAVWSSASGGSSSSVFYLGDPTVDGTWRLFVSGTDLLVQRLESGTWVEKGSFLP